MKNELKQEIIEDVMNDVFDDDIDAEDELIAKVLDEIGIEMDTNLENVPNKKLKDKNVNIDNDDEMDKDLQNRLNALKQ